MADVLARVERSLQLLVLETQALNSATVASIDHTPTALEFSTFVTSNRPLVVRDQGQRDGIRALGWTNSFLERVLQGRKVSVAVDPTGRADSIVDDAYFVTPATVDMTLSDLFDRLDRSDDVTGTPIYYLQSQDGNLSKPGDLSALIDDIGERNGPSFAQDVFGEPPEAVNIWIGDGKSVTSMHRDPFENMYLVVRGTKTFTLIPPTEFYCLHEQEYPLATYSYEAPSTFTVVPTPSASPVPWIPVDPTSPNLALYPRFRYSRPLTVTLHAGDMLYLPRLWYHHVTQAVGPSPDGVGTNAAIAVNWWYDMKMDGSFWSVASFIRRSTLLLDGRVEAEDPDLFS